MEAQALAFHHNSEHEHDPVDWGRRPRQPRHAPTEEEPEPGTPEQSEASAGRIRERFVVREVNEAAEVVDDPTDNEVFHAVGPARERLLELLAEFPWLSEEQVNIADLLFTQLAMQAWRRAPGAIEAVVTVTDTKTRFEVVAVAAEAGDRPAEADPGPSLALRAFADDHGIVVDNGVRKSAWFELNHSVDTEATDEEAVPHIDGDVREGSISARIVVDLPVNRSNLQPGEVAMGVVTSARYREGRLILHAAEIPRGTYRFVSKYYSSEYPKMLTLTVGDDHAPVEFGVVYEVDRRGHVEAWVVLENADIDNSLLDGLRDLLDNALRALFPSGWITVFGHWSGAVVPVRYIRPHAPAAPGRAGESVARPPDAPAPRREVTDTTDADTVAGRPDITTTPFYVAYVDTVYATKWLIMNQLFEKYRLHQFSWPAEMDGAATTDLGWTDKLPDQIRDDPEIAPLLRAFRVFLPWGEPPPALRSVRVANTAEYPKELLVPDTEYQLYRRYGSPLGAAAETVRDLAVEYLHPTRMEELAAAAPKPMSAATLRKIASILAELPETSGPIAGGLREANRNRPARPNPWPYESAWSRTISVEPIHFPIPESLVTTADRPLPPVPGDAASATHTSRGFTPNDLSKLLARRRRAR